MQKLTCIFHLIVSYTAQLRADLMEGMIVGGALANITNHPYTGLLKSKCLLNNKEVVWTCGASIVNQNILLTAAHCIYECDNSSKIWVHVGSERKNEGQPYNIYSFVLHGDYDAKSVRYDIGLLKTRKRIKFSEKVSRVALMRKPPYTEPATLAGWGYIDEEKGIKGPELKSVVQKVWNRSDCLDILNNIPSGTICAAADLSTEYAAKGDSGSALVVRGYIEIGLVSFKQTILAKYLVVYTDIGYYYNWIKVNSRKIHCLKE